MNKKDYNKIMQNLRFLKSEVWTYELELIEEIQDILIDNNK